MNAVDLITVNEREQLAQLFFDMAVADYEEMLWDEAPTDATADSIRQEAIGMAWNADQHRESLGDELESMLAEYGPEEFRSVLKDSYSGIDWER